MTVSSPVHRKDDELEKRREKARLSQKAYRALQKQRVEIAGERVIELKRTIFDSALYLAFIVQRDMLKSSRFRELRQLAMEIYGDYFKSGADPLSKFFKKQETFLAFQISDDLVYPPHRMMPGYLPLLQQWVIYTMLTDHFTMEKVKVEQLDPDAAAFLLTQTLSYTITYRFIAAVYPHMLNDQLFLKKVLGKTISYGFSQRASFSAENRISSLQLQSKLAEGWLRLLKDPILTARVVKDQLIDHGAYITTSLENIQQICKWHHL